MSELSEVNYQAGAFSPWLRLSPRARIEPTLLAAPRKLPFKDSVFALGFLSFYVTAYLAVGFAGIKALGWVWTAVFG
jgi:hypothetical protein